MFYFTVVESSPAWTDPLLAEKLQKCFLCTTVLYLIYMSCYVHKLSCIFLSPGWTKNGPLMTWKFFWSCFSGSEITHWGSNANWAFLVLRDYLDNSLEGKYNWDRWMNIQKKIVNYFRTIVWPWRDVENFLLNCKSDFV